MAARSTARFGALRESFNRANLLRSSVETTSAGRSVFRAIVALSDP
jgi:hypothetical protein